MHPSESACAWPAARIRRAIAAEFPRFRRASIRVIRRGHALVVDVNRRFIFKFVWHPKADLGAEIALLRRLHGRLGVATPNPVFVPRNRKFFGYPMIPGRTPRRAEVARWNADHRDRFAARLADLSRAVQRAIPPRVRVRVLGPKPAPYDARAVRADLRASAAIFRHDRRLVRRMRSVVRDYRRRRAGLTRADLDRVGFDLQLDNLLVDGRGMLAGAVDFGYLTWQDASGMFGLLAKDDFDLASRAMAHYTRRTGERPDPSAAAADGGMTVFSYLVELSTNRWDMAARRREWLALARRYPDDSVTR